MRYLHNFKSFTNHSLNENSSSVYESVAAILGDKMGRVLILQRGSGYTDENGVWRKNPWMPLKWTLVGGVVDEGESFEQACAREIEEETTLSVSPNSLGKVKTIYDKAENYNLHIFQTSQYSGRVDIEKHPPENVDYKWVSRDDYMDYDYVPYTKELLEEFWNIR